MDRLTTLSRRAKHIYETDGIVALLRRGFHFLAYCLIEYRGYWLYTDPTPNGTSLKEVDFMPSIDDFTFKIVTSNQEADEMEAQGFEFCSQVPNAAEKLDKWAVAFCIFVGNELAHIVWFAMNREAKDAFNELPYKLDFSKGEVCSAAAWTHPKYRQAGLHSYNTFKRMEFSLRNGIVRNRYVVSKKNLAPQAADARFGNVRFGEARLLRILWWKSWKERPVSPQGSALKREAQ